MSRPPLIRNFVSATRGGELSSANDLLLVNNQLINSAFDFGQRILTSTNPVNGSFVSDRWMFTSDYSDGTIIFSRPRTDAIGFFPGATRYCLHVTQSVADTVTTFKVIQQKIEDVYTLAGKTVTVSFWGVGAATVQIGLSQVYGTGGSPSASNQLTLQPVVMTSGLFQQYSVTFDVPLVTGTLGSNGDDALYMQFFLPLNSTFDIALAHVMVSEGPIAGPWSYAGGHIGGELSLCQRYFEKSAPLDNAILTTGANGEFIVWPSVSTFGSQFPARYKVRKRVDTHTAIAYSNVTGVANKVRNYTGGADDTATITGITAYGYTGFSGTSVTANNQYGWQWYADAEF